MTFRKATQADAAAIAQMEKRYIECPWSENVVRQTLADELSTIYLLCEGEKVIGYGGLKMVLDTAEIYKIAVHEEHRRKGCATEILQKLLAHAVVHGGKEVFLEVNENNVAACKLYMAHGFKISHMRKNYYTNGHALILRLEI